jgi:hypothetical protein
MFTSAATSGRLFDTNVIRMPLLDLGAAARRKR